MQRREFLALVAGLASTGVLSSHVQAQRNPVIGFLNTASREPAEPFLAAFRKGLGKVGFTEGQNVAIEYRWAEGQYGRLDALAADLVRQNPAVIAATGGTVAAKVVKTLTSTIPILFIAGFDPVYEGLVASINKPAGNATGVAVYTAELGKKRFEMLQLLVPGRPIAMLVNPDAASTALEIKDAQTAADALGFSLIVIEARHDDDIRNAFEIAVSRKAAVQVSADSFFTSRRTAIVELAAYHRLPACYPWPQYVDAGGLISYGANLAWAYEQNGVYAARILKGEKPGDLPVQLPTIFETTINLRTAKAMSIDIPQRLLVTAERVIE
jgi:putative ABC transport system substrate-binding protein